MKVEVERRGAVWVLTLNRPEVHNAVDGETAELITAGMERFSADDEARVLVVTGAGGKAFCSGAAGGSTQKQVCVLTSPACRGIETTVPGSISPRTWPRSA